MNRNDDRVTRAQRRRMDSEFSQEIEPTIDRDGYEGFDSAAPRRRRSQAVRMQMGEGIEEPLDDDAGLPPPREVVEKQRMYGRPKATVSTPPPPSRRDPVLRDDVPVDEDTYVDSVSLYDDEDDELDGGRRKGSMLRWIIISVVILALLATATFIGLRRPDLIEPVVKWGSELINGPAPTPEPTPEPTPVPTPQPTAAPDAAMAKVVSLSANPEEQPDINLPISFQVTTTEQTTRVRIVDDNGQILIEGLENDYTDVNYGRVWNLTVYFLTPYEGNVEAYPGNEAGWNEANSSVISIKIGGSQAEAPPESQLVQPTVDNNAAMVNATVDTPTPVSVTGQVYVQKQAVEYASRESAVFMGDVAEYTGENGLLGVITFRGSSMRQNAAFGTALVAENKLESVWTANAGMAGDGHATWGAQPLIAQWHANLRKMMPMNDAKRDKSVLKEVIFAGNNGSLYFFDLDDGAATRETLTIDPAMPMLGTPSIYPNGVPLLMVGSGDPSINVTDGSTGLFIYDLLMDVQEQKAKDPTASAKRVQISSEREEAVSGDRSFITSPLIAQPPGMMTAIGGNGLLYTMMINPTINQQTESVVLNKPTMESYAAEASGVDMSVDSALASYGDRAYYATNGGILQCVNLNSLTTEWAVNLGVDTDAAIALEANYTGGSSALYTASRADAQGYAHLRRVNADTGEVQWDRAVQGNCSASPVVGINGISDLVVFTVSDAGMSTVFALNKETGDTVWEQVLDTDTTSSPVAIYDGGGSAWIVQGDGAGLHLLSGVTGERLDMLALSSPVIGSPAAFDNMIVVATQDAKLQGVRLK